MPTYTHTFNPSGIHRLTPPSHKPSISNRCGCSKGFSISSLRFLECPAGNFFNDELNFELKSFPCVNFVFERLFLDFGSGCLFCFEFSASNYNREQNKNFSRSSCSKVIFLAAQRRISVVLKSNEARNNYLHRQNTSAMVCSVSNGRSSGVETESSGLKKKRKVVEHICMIKGKGDLSDEQENVMLDYLYTSQYQMGGIIAISLGRVSDRNPDGYTHAVFMRFHKREDLEKFYENSFYLRVLKEHVIPYCHGLISVDYESEVEDDILPIFRKGEEFNYGVEFVLLISVVDNALDGPIEDALASLAKLTFEFPSIVQSTQGSNFNQNSREYTHGAVIRFQSLEAFKIFVASSEYKNMWMSKFQPITRKISAVHFSVDPVGTEIM